MSQSNAPFNRPGQPESADANPNWENPFADLAEDVNLQDGSSIEAQLEDLLFEPPDRSASSVEQSLTDSTAVIAAWSDAWSENGASSSELTEVTDLISLIQELNQCNSILLDRVSQLEEALESSETALQAEVGRSQDYIPNSTPTHPSQSDTRDRSDLASTQEQIVSLFNQLEFAHQANQRQQILIETLTEQLESSQERVAELEREAALTQLRYSEQVQRLTQSDATNRDLQARLHRQQRYTLQFKTALEKCLEVPTPQYDLGVEAAAAGENPLLLKAQQIQPWAAESEAATRFNWMKLYPGSLDEVTIDESQSLAAQEQDLPDVPERLPDQDLTLPLPTVEPPATSVAAPEPVAAEMQIPTDLKQPLADPVSADQLKVAVKPLAELLAEAVHSIVPPVPVIPDLSFADADADAVAAATSEALISPAPLPNAAPADAEDALWQDLARLIEVSTEDVVRASLSGDFSAFEAIDFDALPTIEAPTEVRVPELQAPLPTPEPLPPAASEAPAADGSFIPALAHSSWPSPVVHPLRSAKKQKSSGSVDLPSFVRPGTNPLAT